MYYLLIYYSSNEIGRLLPIFLKAPNNEHKVCKEAMRNMWSCDFPFCDVQNYHGNLGIFVLKYHWMIIEIFRGLFVGTLHKNLIENLKENISDFVVSTVPADGQWWPLSLV